MIEVPTDLRGLATRHALLLSCLSFVALAFSATVAAAHNVTPGDAGYIQEYLG